MIWFPPLRQKRHYAGSAPGTLRLNHVMCREWEHAGSGSNLAVAGGQMLPTAPSARKGPFALQSQAAAHPPTPATKCDRKSGRHRNRKLEHLTHTLGAEVADQIDKPIADGGLALGRLIASPFPIWRTVSPCDDPVRMGSKRRTGSSDDAVATRRRGERLGGRTWPAWF